MTSTIAITKTTTGLNKCSGVARRTIPYCEHCFFVQKRKKALRCLFASTKYSTDLNSWLYVQKVRRRALYNFNICTELLMQH